MDQHQSIGLSLRWPDLQNDMKLGEPAAGIIFVHCNPEISVDAWKKISVYPYWIIEPQVIEGIVRNIKL